MRHVILASHHSFAEGLRDTLEFIGGIKDIKVICAYMNDVSLTDQVKEVFSNIKSNDEVLILTDILQGSVTQALTPYMQENCFLVAGVNVPCALELALCKSPLTVEKIRHIISIARDSIQLVNSYKVDISDDDE